MRPNDYQRFTRTLVTSLVMALFNLASVEAREVACQGGKTLVESSSNQDIRHVCEGARKAIQFLVSNGLKTHKVSISVVSHMPEGIPESALGAFSRTEKRIYVLTYSEFEKHNALFDIPIDESIYRAVIAHEVAHAIAFHNFKEQPTLLGQEYIGFVTLFSTLDQVRRKQILWGYDYDEDWLKHAHVLYLIDPLEFGAHAYWHFLRQENSQHFFRKILDGHPVFYEE